MAEPVIERIMQAVRSRMDDAFREAYRSTQFAAWQPKDSVIHVHQGAITPNEAASCPGNPPAQGYEVEAIVAGIVKPGDSDPTPIDTFRNRLAADIVKAATSVDLWHQWGGLAINTTIGTAEPYTEESGGVSGVMVRFLITFRVSENDPYTVRS